MNKAVWIALALAGVLTGLGVLVLVCQSADRGRGLFVLTGEG